VAVAVHRDGNGWVTCDEGHQHWGLFGAAGLLVSTRDGGQRQVLLQLRATTSHFGGTWGLPGGARDSHETGEQAALREAGEETTLDTSAVVVVDRHLDDHGGWSYLTVLADSATAAPAGPLAESDAVAWIAVDSVVGLPLHPGFAASWPDVRAILEQH
jgi:8-oxo-dGTP diphosphatase